MRTLVFSMLTMVSMVACTNESDPIQEVNDKPVEIKLNAGIITTKAPIESTNDLPKEELTDVQFVKAPDGASAVWTGVSAAITAKITTQGKIEFGTPQQYNVDNANKTFLIGYYPAAAISNGELTWTPTGKEDIIVAPVVSGSKVEADQIKAPVAFAHQLTQLRFKIKNTNNADWGTLSKIILTGTGLKTTAKYDLATAALSWEGQDLSEFAVYTATTTDGTTSYTDTPLADQTIAIPTADFSLCGYTMVQPLDEATSYSLNVTTSKRADVVVNVTLAEAPKAGSAYVVELTFASTEITATATIAPWKEVASGNAGTVD